MNLHNKVTLFCISVIVLGFVYILNACSSTSAPILTQPQFDTVELQNKLQDGDLICRLGSAWYSNHISRIISKEQKFSHIGILIWSSKTNQWFVCHAEEDIEKGHNGVVLESLDSFCASAKNIGIYRLPNLTKEEKDRISKEITRLLTSPITFDTTFGDSDVTTVYCTELIAQILKTISHYSPTPTLNMPWFKAYSLDDVTLYLEAKEIYNK